MLLLLLRPFSFEFVAVAAHASSSSFVAVAVADTETELALASSSYVAAAVVEHRDDEFLLAEHTGLGDSSSSSDASCSCSCSFLLLLSPPLRNAAGETETEQRTAFDEPTDLSWPLVRCPAGSEAVASVAAVEVSEMKKEESSSLVVAPPPALRPLRLVVPLQRQLTTTPRERRMTNLQSRGLLHPYLLVGMLLGLALGTACRCSFWIGRGDENT